LAGLSRQQWQYESEASETAKIDLVVIRFGYLPVELEPNVG
jgi:hypothetical protein